MRKTEIYINASQISSCLKNKDANNSTLVEVNEQLKTLKKKGAQVPEKLEKTNEHYSVYLENLKKYEQYSSIEYLRATLGYKLSRKLKKLLEVMEQNKPEKVQEIFKELRGGLNKPVFEEKEVINKEGKKVLVQKIKSHTIRLHFSELGSIPENITLEELKEKMRAIEVEFAATNKLFELKREQLLKNIKIPKTVKYFVAYLLQETVSDIVNIALKEAKKADVGLQIDHFSRKNIEKSVCGSLFTNLECVKNLEAYLQRKRDYENEVATAKSKKVKLSHIKSFNDVEKADGHMKELTEKGVRRRFWKGLNVSGTVNFITQISRIIDENKLNLNIDKEKKKDNEVKREIGMRISKRVKEFLSLLMQEFLNNLVKRFTILSEYRKTIDVLKDNQKVSKLKKTITLYDIREIFDLLLCSNEAQTELLNNACKVYKQK